MFIKADNVFHTKSSTGVLYSSSLRKGFLRGNSISFSFLDFFKFKFITTPFRSTYVCHSEPRNNYKGKLRENTVPNEKISALWIGIENNTHVLLFSI